MSEQKKPSFMAELDLWTEANILHPAEVGQGETAQQIRYAIREKVLESYKNGCKAGAGAVRKELKR